MRLITCLTTLSCLLPSVFFSQNDIDSDLLKLETFLRSIDSKYVDSVSTSVLVEKGIKAMLEELDPHSTYLTAKQYKAANEPLEGKYEGIGIRFQMIDDTLTVLEVLSGGAAERVGIKMGDQLIAVDGDTVAGKRVPTSEVTTKFKSESSRPVTVNVWRKQEHERFIYSLQRGQIQISSVPAYFMAGSRTGYIKLQRFSSTSLEDFRTALDALAKKNIHNLILDLRGNSGGYLNVAIKIADEFLSERKLIVYTEGIHQPRKETTATTGGDFVEGNLAILVDENSASASEIVAGAVQDWDRGLIIGRRSFGKGLVQRTVEFTDGSAMRLTISRYYTPTGRSIQKPYMEGEEGLKAYRMDLSNREETGELYNADSIRVDENLVYYTPGGREVYGGGGIIPDVFVSVDTSGKAEPIKELTRSGLHYAFALHYSQKHAADLDKKYTDVARFASRFVLDNGFMGEMRSFYHKRGVKWSTSEYMALQAEISEAVKPLIARFHYGYIDYHFMAAQYDPVIRRALEEFEKGTFHALGLN